MWNCFGFVATINASVMPYYKSDPSSVMARIQSEVKHLYLYKRCFDVQIVLCNTNLIYLVKLIVIRFFWIYSLFHICIVMMFPDRIKRWYSFLHCFVNIGKTSAKPIRNDFQIWRLFTVYLKDVSALFIKALCSKTTLYFSQNCFGWSVCSCKFLSE